MPKKKPPQTAFGDRLVALRRQRGLTQVQLAEASGLTQRVISYWETMPAYPAAPAIVALAKALHVSTDELLGMKALPKAATATQPPEERRLWRHLRVVAALPERDQRAVLRLIDTAARAHRAG
jgi:transcriptional regulator with XRE-family HTH domain